MIGIDNRISDIEEWPGIENAIPGTLYSFQDSNYVHDYFYLRWVDPQNSHHSVMTDRQFYGEDTIRQALDGIHKRISDLAIEAAIIRGMTDH